MERNPGKGVAGRKEMIIGEEGEPFSNALWTETALRKGIRVPLTRIINYSPPAAMTVGRIPGIFATHRTETVNYFWTKTSKPSPPSSSLDIANISREWGRHPLVLDTFPIISAWKICLRFRVGHNCSFLFFSFQAFFDKGFDIYVTTSRKYLG